MPNLDTLVLEAFTWTPHLETAGEIALKDASTGRRTGFLFLHARNPDERMLAASPITLGMYSRRNKVVQLERVLSRFGVTIASEPRVSDRARRDIRAFAADAPLSLDALRQYRYGEARLGLGVTSSLVAGTLHPYPDPAQHRSLLTACLTAAATCFEMASASLRALAPARVVSFNGRFACSTGIAEAARVCGVPIVYHERGATIERYELYRQPSQDPRFIQTEVARYWGSAGSGREEIGTEYFRRRRSGEGIGWESFVGSQQAGMLPTVSPDHRQLVYFTSGDHELEFAGSRPHGRLFANQRAAVLHLIDWVATHDGVELTIRVHPNVCNGDADDRRWWHSLAGERTRVVPADSPVDTYALIDRADVVITSGSTTGIEAAFVGRPSILLNEAQYSGLGSVYEPGSPAELDVLLGAEALPALPRASCLPYGYYQSVFGTPYEFYRPRSLFSGDFIDGPLGYEREWLRRSRTLDAARSIRRIFRPS